ncbi:MAG TPA: hypothetical protein VJH20_02015, partial [Candidatus Nanoarchaeia archaeon]|nr:hypothetical protein [Candidatus Nanoarchaeia archaeon]
MVQNYTQTTYETCFAVSLLQAVNRIKPIKISQKLELDCIIHSLKFSKYDFVIGHMDFISRKFNVNIERFFDNKYFFNYVRKLKSVPNTKMCVNKIGLNLINKILDRQPILLVDSFYFNKVYHYPHWITLLDKIGSKYRIFDTWEGKEKIINSRILAKAVSSLRNHLKM